MELSRLPAYDEEERQRLTAGKHDVVDENDDEFFFAASERDRVQRRLKSRHVQMIAIAGTLGSGLFVSSGQVLNSAGPLGALLVYALVGSVAYTSLASVGEMTSHAPISGTFPHFASRWVDPAFGFAVGWNYFFTNAVAVSAEIAASVLLIGYWDTSVATSSAHRGGYTFLLCVLVVCTNLFGVQFFGESEFIYSTIKLCLITGVIIFGLVYDLGGVAGQPIIGFQRWVVPGPFGRANLVDQINLDQFLGVIGGLVQTTYAFQGMELVAIAASETESPRRNIKRAVRRVFLRICIFYLLGIFVVGLTVASDDPLLLSRSPSGGVSTSQSPFIIAINRAGINTLPTFVNAGFLISAFSAGNSFLFAASRILYGLAIRGQAPRIFTYCTESGIPIIAVGVTSCFTLLSFINVNTGATQGFSDLVNLATVTGLFTWMSINLTFIFFHRGMRWQGMDRRQLIYHNDWQPYLAIYGFSWSIVFIALTGFRQFFKSTKYDIGELLSSYINIPIFICLYVFWKLFKRTSVWKPREMDFHTGIPSLEETETPEVPKPWYAMILEL